MKKNVCFFICMLFFSSLEALPSEEMFYKRVVSGLKSYQFKIRRNDFTERHLKAFEPLIKSIIRRERELEKTHYQFVTSQDSIFIAYQVILKEWYKIKCQKKFDDYEFLRPYNHCNYEQNLHRFLSLHPDLSQLNRVIQKSLGMTGRQSDAYWASVHSDALPAVSKQLISASFTLESTPSLDSALYVFATKKGVCQESSYDSIFDLLMEVFHSEKKFTPSVKNALYALIKKAPISKEGVIMQIFVPKNEVSNVVYIANTGGFVRQNETRNIHKHIELFQRKRESVHFDAKSTDQVRILGGALSPDKAKIYRYSTVDERAIRAYEVLVRNFFEKNICNSDH